MRLIILMLSMGSVVAYGYALAGYGAQLIGGVINYAYIAGGLSGGTLSAIAAIRLWKLWLRKEEESARKEDSG